jgi:hypothetical protein
MNIKDLKEAVGEMMNEVSLQGLMDVADDLGDTHYDDHFFGDLSPIEKKVIIGLAQTGGTPKARNISFEKLTRIVAGKVGATVHPMWPKHEAFAADADGDVKFDPMKAKHFVCKTIKDGGDGDRIRHVEGECPMEAWGIKKVKGKDKGNWWATLDKPEKQVLQDVESKVIDGEYADIDFANAVEQSAGRLGINIKSLQFMGDTQSIKKAKLELAKKLSDSGEKPLSETKSKKRGFGEGNPPNEEIYKKREVVQEIEAETPDVAKQLGDASKEQGEATMGVADAHTRGAEAAKQRQEASKAWKDAKITQIKAVDAAEKHAGQEAKAMDAQSKAMDAAQKAADAGEKAAAEKEKMIDIAKDAHEQEKEAATAAEEAAAAEEEAAAELADTNTAAAKTDTERSEIETEFGDAVTSDEEARAEAEEDAGKEEEKADKEEEEADKKEKEADMKAADEKAAQDAEEDDEKAEATEEEDEEPQGMTEIIKAMVREALTERKWGDEGKPAPNTQEKLKAAGITADELRGMVLQTVMKGEEERDIEMIKILKDMLGSLQSIEYHTTPEKGASSQLAQAIGKGWVSESKNRAIISGVPTIIREMRQIGLGQEADDHESFFKWVLSNSSLTMQEIKNEADAQIADLQKMLRKLSDHATGKEDSLEKQKLRGEVPGHH